MVVSLKGNIDVKTSASALKGILSILKKKTRLSLIIDMAGVRYFDDYGALILMEIRQVLIENKGNFKIVNLSETIKEILSGIVFDESQRCIPLVRKKSMNLFVRFGDATMRHANHFRQMISFVGSVTLAFAHVVIHPRSLRVGDTLLIMERTGTDALPIIGLISFLLGLIMAFMSSLQLSQFGANIYVASLVGLAMVSELGPIMTAIIVAGRSGSAFAAEIGTMKISEEVDALFTMGFNPALFLAVPRILATVLVLPLLTLFSSIFAIAGGLFIGVFMLDLTMGAYINQTLEILTLFEVLWGLMKSVVFAALIAWVGCLRGFQASGGAAAVGNAATSAVVSSIFLIILFDSIFAVMRSYWS
jgi:phospholipid/cholesterol/gamma-HCH transport system permease protein